MGRLRRLTFRREHLDLPQHQSQPRQQTGDIYVNTAKSGTTISPAQAFTDVLPITPEIPNEYITTTIDGEILGVEKVALYLSRCKCNKKIEIVTQHPVVECSDCHLKQKQSFCPKKLVHLSVVS